MTAGDAGDPQRKPASRRRTTSIAVAAILLAVAVGVLVFRATIPERPYTLVDGPVPSYVTGIPSATVNGTLASALKEGWWASSDAWPSYDVYRLLSRQFWLAGTPFQDLFFLPVSWPSRLNLSANDLSLDPSGQYLIVPFEVRLQISGGDLWVYTLLHGLTQNPFDDDCGCSLNHFSPYGFGMLVREQQYQLTWFLHLQSDHEEVIGYNPALPDAYSSPIFGNRSGLSPIRVDGQLVYASGSSGIEEYPIPPASGYAPGAWPIDPSQGHGVSVVLSNSTLFVFDLPLAILPHTASDVLFQAMFVLEVWPPVGVDAFSQALDYKPGSPVIRDIPSGPDGWNNTAAYLAFSAPLSG